jgi:hypothetical protein
MNSTSKFKQPAEANVKKAKLIPMSCDDVLKYGPESLC